MRDIRSRRQYLAATALGVAALAGCVDGSDDEQTGTSGADDGTDGNEEESDGAEIHAGYETTEVTVESADGEELGSVTAAIADSRDLRHTGLSDTESLPDDRGMLFVYGERRGLTYVMREMDFPIDIVYADPDGTITGIHHARAPGPDEDGNDLRYPGSGQYVLEVTHEWTTARGVEVGDRLVFELP